MSAATQLTLSAAPNPALVGQAVTLQATVTSSSGTPTGSVTFYDGATTLGTVALASGSASLSTSWPSPGAHAILALYSGNGSFSGSVAGLSLVVSNPAALPTNTTLAVSPNPQSLRGARRLSP